MEKYNITGMSCAACQARVEKAVAKVPGVDSVAVSLLTNSMGVEGNASGSEIIKAIEAAGYGASVQGADSQGKRNSALAQQEKALEDHETPVLIRRLISSACVLTVLMYFSMGHMMFNWPIPKLFDGNHVGTGLLEMILAALVMLINKKFFTSGFKSFLHLAPNMDTLVAMGSMTSFLWSLFVLFRMTGDMADGNYASVMKGMNNLYFESAAMIVTLITVGKLLEALSKGRTTDALKSLMKLAPETAVIEKDGENVLVQIEDVQLGDIFVVKPGDSVPLDGIIVEGATAVDESALTGESIPVDKQEGDEVSAATINKSGYFKARATRIGEDTTLSRIIELVSDAAATKAPIAKIADKVSGIFVPAVIAIAALVTVIWLFIGQTPGYALARGIAVLVISCPCALGLATPVAIMVGSGMGAKNGILFKTAGSLEETGRIQIVALDKTGTITKGEPAVTDLIPAEGVTKSQLLNIANALEERSEHPFAKAISNYYETNKDRLNLGSVEITDFTAVTGQGITAKLAGKDRKNELFAGSLKFIETIVTVSADFKEKAEELAVKGKTPLLFAGADKLIGMIAVADAIKEDSHRAIDELKKQGLHVVMLTGDNEKTAKAIGDEAGVDQVIAGVLPEGKEKVIRQLSEYGRVAMVGDGINDAPALTRANVGIAIGAGADVAIETADVVLMNSKLSDVSAAIRLSRATLKNIHENLFWAFFYNILLIPLAAGAYVHLMHGWSMNPMWGAAAMSLSSFCVCINALRLNLFDLHSAAKDKPAKLAVNSEQLGIDAVENIENNNTNNFKEENTMTKTMNIEGMMCGHCEATVKKALEGLDGVKAAEVSYEKGTAMVELTNDVADDVLKKAVEDKEYKVVSIA